ARPRSSPGAAAAARDFAARERADGNSHRADGAGARRPVPDVAHVGAEERVERGNLLARPAAGARRGRPDELPPFPGADRLGSTRPERQGLTPAFSGSGLRWPEAGRVGRDDAALAGFLCAVESVVRALEERDRIILCAQLCDACGQKQLPTLA